jgi:hypothetical protein
MGSGAGGEPEQMDAKSQPTIKNKVDQADEVGKTLTSWLNWLALALRILVDGHQGWW